MHKRHAPKITLFFMEFVLVIFFFAVYAAICMHTFGAAQQMAKDSDNLNQAVFQARSVASCYKASAGDLQIVAKMENGILTEDTLWIYYDQAWNEASQPTADGFAVRICRRDTVGEVDIDVLEMPDDSEVLEREAGLIFSLPVKTHGGK